MTTYQLEKYDLTGNEEFRSDFNEALRKNAYARISWMLQKSYEKEYRRFPPDKEILPKELFEI